MAQFGSKKIVQPLLVMTEYHELFTKSILLDLMFNNSVTRCNSERGKYVIVYIINITTPFLIKMEILSELLSYCPRTNVLVIPSTLEVLRGFLLFIYFLKTHPQNIVF